MKIKYEKPELEIINFGNEDFMTSSNNGNHYGWEDPQPGHGNDGNHGHNHGGNGNGHGQH